MPQNQVHSKFKVFAGALASDHGLGSLASEVEAFAAAGSIAPKSIGVEYLEGAKKLVITLGYRDDEAGYGIKMSTCNLGVIADLEAGSLADLEGRMAKAADKVSNVICHELYVTEANEFHMVFMSKA